MSKLSIGTVERIGFYSLGVNLVLTVLKLGLSVVTNSLALRADAIHSLVDVFGSLVVIAGLMIARRKSKQFPYGLYKVENLVAVILGIMILFAGYEIGQEAIAGPERSIANASFGLLGVAAAVAVAYLFSRYEGREGRKAESPSLLADSRHFQSDVLASGVVFLSVVGGAYGLPLDRIGAAIVVVFVMWSGWKLMSSGMRVLLDASLDFDTLDSVRKIVEAQKGVEDVRSIQGRSSGRYKFIEIEVSLHIVDLKKAHNLSSNIEEAIKQHVANVDHVLVHCEPSNKDSQTWAIPLDSIDGRISDHFGQAQFIAMFVLSTNNGEIWSQEILANPYAALEKQKGIRVAEFLVSQNVDGVATKDCHEGKGPAYVLAEANVDTKTTSAGWLNEAVGEIQAYIISRSLRQAEPGTARV